MVRAPTLTAEPDLVTILQTYNDVTERLKRSHETLLDEVARLREELHEKNRELQRRERLAALGEMAAGVAHEIRNPLGGIGLYSSLLERDLVDRPAEREIARRISAGVQNLENIVRGVLSFAGDAEPRFAEVPLASVLESALLQTTPQASALDAHIEVDPRLAGVELWCDAGQAERALLNLLFNALDAAGCGGRVWVRLGDADGSDGLVSVVVEDDGPGIAPDCLQRVFNPFFTTKDHGTGLGLAIVHRIAEAHGGCVRAGNRVGGGARFVLSLPLSRENEQSTGRKPGDPRTLLSVRGPAPAALTNSKGAGA